VTKYEPSEVLFIPSKLGDDYYYHLRAIANWWGTPAVVMEVGDIDQATREKSLFEKDEQWKCAIWLDSAANGRVAVAVKSKKMGRLITSTRLLDPRRPIPLSETQETPDGSTREYNLNIPLATPHRPTNPHKT
jgi:hypothetical protein